MIIELQKALQWVLPLSWMSRVTRLTSWHIEVWSDPWSTWLLVGLILCLVYACVLDFNLILNSHICLLSNEFFDIWLAPSILAFGILGELILTCYSDADFSGYKVYRKSTSGTCHFLGHSLVSWFSKKQNSVALLTTEAEYIAAGSCCAQALWMK